MANGIIALYILTGVIYNIGRGSTSGRSFVLFRFLFCADLSDSREINTKSIASFPCSLLPGICLWGFVIFFFLSVVFTFKGISLFAVSCTAICYILLFLCKLLSPLLQPNALVASLLLTRFCNQVFCNICKTLMFYGDAGPGRWERSRFIGWKGDQTFPLLVPERHMLLIFWWFCGCILIYLQMKTVVAPFWCKCMSFCIIESCSCYPSCLCNPVLTWLCLLL